MTETREEKKMERRELIVRLDGDLRSRLIEMEDGGLLVKSIPLLTPGTWTDSNVGIPLEYTADALQEYAANWYLNGLWSRHGGGSPRRANDKIGEVQNPRWENGAVTGDLYYHRATQDSRDTAELLQRGIVSAFSVEHGGRESFITDNTSDPPSYKSRAESLEFYGLAQVEMGACPDAKLMTINLSQLHSSEAPDGNGATETSEDKEMTKEMQELIEEHDKTLQEALGKIKALEAQVAESQSPPEGDKRDEQIRALEKRVKELEEQPAPKAIVETATVELEDSYAGITTTTEGRDTVIGREV